MQLEKKQFVDLEKLTSFWLFQRGNNGRQQIRKSVGHDRAIRFAVLICSGRRDMSITEK